MAAPRLADDALRTLGSALSGRCSLDLPGGFHLRTRALPWGAPAFAMGVEGELFLYWDPDQPFAQRQARELLRGHAPELLGYLGEIGDLFAPTECELVPADTSAAAAIG